MTPCSRIRSSVAFTSAALAVDGALASALRAAASAPSVAAVERKDLRPVLPICDAPRTQAEAIGQGRMDHPTHATRGGQAGGGVDTSNCLLLPSVRFRRWGSRGGRGCCGGSGSTRRCSCGRATRWRRGRCTCCGGGLRGRRRWRHVLRHEGLALVAQLLLVCAEALVQPRQVLWHRGAPLGDVLLALGGDTRSNLGHARRAGGGELIVMGGQALDDPTPA